MRPGDEFFNLYHHGFIRVAMGVPEGKVADPSFNADKAIELMQQAGLRSDRARLRRG